MKSKKILMFSIAAASVLSTAAIMMVGKAGADLLVEASEKEYVATIDKDNPLILVSSSGSISRYAFRLHGGEEYGYAYISNTDSYSTTLPEGYEDYAFSWTYDGTYYLAIFMEARTAEYTVAGQKKILRGFPGAYKFETVLANPSGIGVRADPGSGWSNSSETVGSDTVITATKNDSGSSSNQYNLYAKNEGTFYVKSIKVYYRC